MIADRDELLERYRGLLARIGESVGNHPLFFTRQDDGSTHLEFHPDGSISAIVTERGRILGESRFDQDDDLLYHLLTSPVRAMAASHELAHRIEGPDFRRMLFAREVELMGRISQAWGERRHAEIEVTLQQHPYVDAPGTSGRGSLRLLIGCVVVAIVALLHAPVFVAFHRQDLLRREGVPVEARVTDRSIVENRFVDIHRVSYRFELAGKTFENSETVDARVYERAASGRGIEVRYLPDDPKVAMIAGNDPATRLAWIWGAIDLLLVIAAWRIRSAAAKDQGTAT